MEECIASTRYPARFFPGDPGKMFQFVMNLAEKALEDLLMM